MGKNLDEELFDMVESEDALMAWQGVTYTELKQDEVDTVLKWVGRPTRRTIFMAKILREVKPGNGRRIGPFSSQQDAKSATHNVEQATKLLGWQSTVVNKKTGRHSYAKRTRIQRGVDGRWYVIVARMLNTTASEAVDLS